MFKDFRRKLNCPWRKEIWVHLILLFFSTRETGVKKKKTFCAGVLELYFSTCSGRDGAKISFRV
jgi:hypothetical protein